MHINIIYSLSIIGAVFLLTAGFSTLYANWYSSCLFKECSMLIFNKKIAISLMACLTSVLISISFPTLVLETSNLNFKSMLILWIINSMFGTWLLMMLGGERFPSKSIFVLLLIQISSIILIYKHTYVLYVWIFLTLIMVSLMFLLTYIILINIRYKPYWHKKGVYRGICISNSLL